MSKLNVNSIGIVVHCFPFLWVAKAWIDDYGATVCIGPFRLTVYWADPEEGSVTKLDLEELVDNLGEQKINGAPLWLTLRSKGVAKSDILQAMALALMQSKMKKEAGE